MSLKSLKATDHIAFNTRKCKAQAVQSLLSAMSVVLPHPPPPHTLRLTHWNPNPQGDGIRKWRFGERIDNKHRIFQNEVRVLTKGPGGIPMGWGLTQYGAVRNGPLSVTKSAATLISHFSASKIRRHKFSLASELPSLWYFLRPKEQAMNSAPALPCTGPCNRNAEGMQPLTGCSVSTGASHLPQGKPSVPVDSPSPSLPEEKLSPPCTLVSPSASYLGHPLARGQFGNILDCSAYYFIIYITVHGHSSV